MKRVRIKSLTSNILCKGHNSSLTGLDESAAQFFSAMHRAYSIADGTITQSESFRFNGYVLKRWFLKVVFGLWASRSLTIEASQNGQAPPPLWADLLLGKGSFPGNWGLFVRSESYVEHLHTNSIHISVAESQSGEVTGVLFVLAGVHFALSLSDEFSLMGWGRHRPNSINMGRPPIAHRIALTWIGNAFNPSVDMLLFSEAEAVALTGKPAPALPT